jgi:hypothetical protein
MNSRLQWVQIADQVPISYHTSAFSGQFVFAHPLSESKYLSKKRRDSDTFFSVGFSLIDNNQGGGSFRYNSALVSPSMIVRLAENIYLSGGIEVSFSQFRLRDYILVNDYLQGNNTPNPDVTENATNLSTGILFISQFFWTGLSLKDVVPTPFSDGTALIYRSNHFYDNIYWHGGINYPLREEKDLYLTSSFSFKKRSQNQQLEAGLGIARSYQNGYVWSLSAAYRGLDRNIGELSNTDAAILIAGFNIPNHWFSQLLGKSNSEKVRDLGSTGISISSDFLHSQYSEALRTWEVSIVLNAPSRKSSQNEYKVECQDFLHGPLAEKITKNFYSGQKPYRR